MEDVGFTNISNHFHDSQNYGSGFRGFSKIMEIIGFTNIFYDFPQKNHGKCWSCQHFQQFP